MDEKIRVAIVVDRPRISAAAEKQVLFGWDYEFIVGKLRKVGLPESFVVYMSAKDPDACIRQLNLYPNLTVVVPLGEAPLKLLTGHKSITKWQLSPLDTLPLLHCRKAIPTFHPDAVKKDFALGLYVEMALRRAREEMQTKEYVRKPKRFLLNPHIEETFDVLDKLEKLGKDDWLSVDIETGRGLINTVGFAWTVSDAIAIQTLPSRGLSAESFHKLWLQISRILAGPSKKVMQNGIYEKTYFARYGISIENFAHDSMVAQKYLWPEFPKGLDNVGRFYTNEIYWKDSGRVESEEGKRKDWGDIKEWSRHLAYNCNDTSGTLEATLNQRADMEARGMLGFFDNYLMQLHPFMSEMCLRGLPVCQTMQAMLIAETEAKIVDLTAGLTMQFKKAKKQISAVTRAQKMKLFRDKGYTIPRVLDPETKLYRESVDELSMKKMLQKHPGDTDIPKLLKISEYEKALSSYFKVELDPFTKNVHCMMDIHGTETGRWSATTDAWSRGMNTQTMPKYVKKMVRWTA